MYTLNEILIESLNEAKIIKFPLRPEILKATINKHEEEWLTLQS